MRVISSETIARAVEELSIRANFSLRKDVLVALRQAYSKESKGTKKFLEAIIKNASVADKGKLAICQDTGLPSIFVEIGHDVSIAGDLKKAINKGVERGYRKGFLRSSVVISPLNRGISGYGPAVIHLDLVKGKKLKITLMPKGFGCENKTQLKMFKPTASTEEVKKFIIDVVKSAGPDACPPYVVGVGIGGSADYACMLAKKALLRKLTTNGQRPTIKLERELLGDINKLNIGPMGLGGKTTALAVNIDTYPTHIAGLPVCVNISCHALRSATATI